MPERTQRAKVETYYHVICRDCTTEAIEPEAAAAERRMARHEAETNHRVVVGEL